MSTGVNSDPFKYSPSSIVQIFSNALVIDATKRMMLIKGIYVAGRGNNYNGFYYDTLKDETSDATITLVVPAIIRTGLSHGQTIEAHAYLTKRIQLVEQE